MAKKIIARIGLNNKALVVEVVVVVVVAVAVIEVVVVAVAVIEVEATKDTLINQVIH